MVMVVALFSGGGGVDGVSARVLKEPGGVCVKGSALGQVRQCAPALRKPSTPIEAALMVM